MTFWARSAGLSTERQVCLVSRSVQLSLIPFCPNTCPFSTGRQVTTRSDLPCVGVGASSHSYLGEASGELVSARWALSLGNALGFECKRAWPRCSGPSPLGKILLILKDPNKHDPVLFLSSSQKEQILHFDTSTRHRSQGMVVSQTWVVVTLQGCLTSDQHRKNPRNVP